MGCSFGSMWSLAMHLYRAEAMGKAVAVRQSHCSVGSTLSFISLFSTFSSSFRSILHGLPGVASEHKSAKLGMEHGRWIIGPGYRLSVSARVVTR